MIKLLSLNDLCERLAISPSTYRKYADPANEEYLNDFPKPVTVFDSQKKLRFSSVDVDNFILKHSHTNKQKAA